MATGQTILNLMEALDRGLQLQSGESGVTLALRAANAAQDYLESLLALQPNSFLSSTGTVTTTADTETTTFPTGCNISTPLQVAPRGIWNGWVISATKMAHS